MDEMDEIVIPLINEHALPGLAVGVIRGDELVYAKGFGVADAATERPVTPDTVFRIGSISKTFTTVGLMQLWEQGKFKLDDPVNSYLRRYRVQHKDPTAPPVTFRHLLTHTAGIGEMRAWSDMRKPQFGLGAKLDEPLPWPNDLYAEGLRPEVYPATKWAYANHGFATVGQLVEDISGEPFAEYMTEHVFGPLGMEHTDYLRSERVRAQLAVGYQLRRGGLKPVKDLEIAVAAAGSIFSSVNDMAQYVVALLNGGKNQHGTVLKPETLELMMEPHFQVDERLPGMGLAFFQDKFGGHRIVWHGGGWIGFISAMLTAPDDALGVVVFGNASSMGPHVIANTLMAHLLGAPDPAADLPRPDILDTPHLWSELCGFYGPERGFNTNLRVWMALAGEIEVLVQDNQLTARTLVGPLRRGIPLYRVDPDDPLVFRTSFEHLPHWVAFGRNAAGEVDRASLVGFVYTTLYKRPAMQSLRYRTLGLLGALGGLAVFALGRRRRTKR